MRGSVWYYQSDTGLHIPQPIELRIARSEESPSFIAREILGLTSMTWNNAQSDGRYCVTLGYASKVGEIEILGRRRLAADRYGFNIEGSPA